MKLTPVISEKSLGLAKSGKYTFRVDRGLKKGQIERLIEEVFKVHVKKIRTINVRGENKRTMAGRKRKIQPSKKAIVTLAEKEKIDLFETKK
jgi:large subunit ribosomal protein L23